MGIYKPVTPSAYKNLFWGRPKNYAFAATDVICTLTTKEMHKAMLMATIGFVEGYKGIVPVILQGINKSRNLSVDPRGIWTGNYIPQEYWYYPFRVLKSNEGVLVVCADDDSGLISDDDNGNGFYKSDGTYTSEFSSIIDGLQQLEIEKQFTMQVMSSLKEYELFEPWQIEYEILEERHQVNDVKRINEQKLNSLSANDLMILRDNGALLVAYCQLLSMQNLYLLIRKLHNTKVNSKSVTAEPTAHSSGPMNNEELFEENLTISFDNL